MKTSLALRALDIRPGYFVFDLVVLLWFSRFKSFYVFYCSGCINSLSAVAICSFTSPPINPRKKPSKGTMPSRLFHGMCSHS